MKFSLLVATYGRAEILYSLFDSLVKQSYKDFEVIIVDQNSDNEVLNIVNKYKNSIEINYIKSKRKGLSLSRNIGLGVAQGEIVSFPDDDCIYPEELLLYVNEIFNNNEDLHFCSGIAKEIETGEPLSMKWAKQEQKIKYSNVFNTVISISVFVKKQVVQPFDERFGVGAYYGSGEESDFVISLLKKQAKGMYYPDKINPLHPSTATIKTTPQIRKKNISYAIGLGALFRKHLDVCLTTSLFKVFLLTMIIRPMGGILLGFVSLNKNNILKNSDNLINRWSGFIQFINN
jgi:glycosyltransferase involved in cell wall biosynthesis